MKHNKENYNEVISSEYTNPIELSQDAVGAGRREGRYCARPEVHQLVCTDVAGVPRRRRHLRAGGQPPDQTPGAHRELPHPSGFRRDPPRR